MSVKSPFTTKTERGGYSAGIYKDGDTIVAEDNVGTVIKEGTTAVTVIQAAIDALPTTGTLDIVCSEGSTTKNQGGKIVFSEGVFNISDAISLTGKQHITLSGQGPATVINNQATDGSHAIEAVNTLASSPGFNRLVIKDLMVVGNANSGDGIHMLCVNYNSVLNVFSQSNGGNGIFFGKDAGWGAENKIISGCQCLFNGGNGIYLQGVHETLVSHCHIEENTVGGVLSDGTYNMTLTGCNIEDHGGPEFSHYEIELVNQCRSTSITGNQIEGYICLDPNGSLVPETIQISGNGIEVGGITAKHTAGDSIIDGMTITGNTFFDTRGMKLTSVKKASIAGNTWSDRGGSIIQWGPKFIDCREITFTGNSTWNRGGVWIEGVCHNFILGNNNIRVLNDDGSTGIHFGIHADLAAGSTNIQINNNAISKIGSYILDAGIYLGTTTQGIYCHHNILTGATIGIDDKGTNNILEKNIGHVTDNSGNSTGTGTQQTIAHGLAATPTKVILWNIENGANAYQSASADGTNIYVTAVVNQDYGWGAEII